MSLYGYGSTFTIYGKTFTFSNPKINGNFVWNITYWNQLTTKVQFQNNSTNSKGPTN